MNAKNMSFLGIAVGSVGIFFGFYYYFQGNVALAVGIVTLSAVGILGVLGFIRHVFLQKEDAKRMGWEMRTPGLAVRSGFCQPGFWDRRVVVGAGELGSGRARRHPGGLWAVPAAGRAVELLPLAGG